jgi:hypothetical protein
MNRQRLAASSPRQRQQEAEIEDAGDGSDPIGAAIIAWRNAYETRYRKEQPDQGVHPADDEGGQRLGAFHYLPRIEDRVEGTDAQTQYAPYPPTGPEHFYRAPSASGAAAGNRRGVFVISMATLEEEPE